MAGHTVVPEEIVLFVLVDIVVSQEVALYSALAGHTAVLEGVALHSVASALAGHIVASKTVALHSAASALAGHTVVPEGVALHSAGAGNTVVPDGVVLYLFLGPGEESMGMQDQ